MIDITGYCQTLYAPEESFFYQDFDREAENEDLHPVL